MQLNGSKYYDVSLTIQLNISHLFIHSYIDQKVLFLTIQSNKFICTEFKWSNNSIWPIDQVLPLQARVDLEWQRGMLHSPKLQHYWSLTIRFLVSYPEHLLEAGSYPSAEMQLVCFTTPAFANGPGDLGSIPGRVIPKTLKMELDTTLLNTQHYKVRFKGKVEQSREWSSALPYTLV